MAIKHTAVSYYGLNYVEHAKEDFKEMIEHGCDTVILAITEFDVDFWFPNINNIVKTAHELGLRVIADTWGIGKYFDVVVASAEAGYAKPDLQIFELALEQSGCMAKNAAMIGDRLDNDIVPAKKLGMKTIWARQEFAKHQKINDKSAQPDYTVDNLNELLEIL